VIQATLNVPLSQLPGPVTQHFSVSPSAQVTDAQQSFVTIMAVNDCAFGLSRLAFVLEFLPLRFHAAAIAAWKKL
jgi:hypothetical protein